MMKSLAKLLGLTRDERTDGGLVFHPSETCPECGTKLAARRVEFNESPIAVPSVGQDGDSCNSSRRNEEGGWFCPNLDCPVQERARIEHWCSAAAMDIAGGNPELVAKLVAQGLVRDAAELYRLKVAELAALEGLDQDSAQRFFDAITASLNRDAWRLLLGLGIPTVGVTEATALGKRFPSVDAVFAAGAPRLMQETELSETVAENIVRWYGDSVNRRLVKRLEKAGLNFKSALYRAGG